MCVTFDVTNWWTEELAEMANISSHNHNKNYFHRLEEV